MDHYLSFRMKKSENSCLVQQQIHHVRTCGVTYILSSHLFLQERSSSTSFHPNFHPMVVTKGSLKMKYIREAAAGRVSSITLESILQFATCCDIEPILGFAFNPTITLHQWVFLNSSENLHQQHILVATL